MTTLQIMEAALAACCLGGLSFSAGSRASLLVLLGRAVKAIARRRASETR